MIIIININIIMDMLNIKDIYKPTTGSPTVTVFQLHINQ